MLFESLCIGLLGIIDNSLEKLHPIEPLLDHLELNRLIDLADVVFIVNHEMVCLNVNINDFVLISNYVMRPFLL